MSTLFKTQQIMKPTKFTKSEHIQTGTDLLSMDKQIHALALQLSHAYGSTSTEAKQAAKMRKALLLIRSELENRLCREQIGMHNATHVYFGTDESRARAGIVAKTTQSE